jgi:hypothetical protein
MHMDTQQQSVTQETMPQSATVGAEALIRRVASEHNMTFSAAIFALSPGPAAYPGVTPGQIIWDWSSGQDEEGMYRLAGEPSPFVPLVGVVSVAAVANAVRAGTLLAESEVYAVVEDDLASETNLPGGRTCHVERIRVDEVQIPQIYVVALAEADALAAADRQNADAHLPPEPYRHTHLTHPQFLRALALARYHSHGWATQFDLLGIDPSHRDEQVYDQTGLDLCGCPPGQDACGSAFHGQRPPNNERIWQRTRRRKLADATPEEMEALQRVELAWAVRGEVANADLETISLIGSAEWSEQALHGIWSPGLDPDGDTAHETGTGRLEWFIRRDGSAVLNVCRPGEELYRVRVYGPAPYRIELSDQEGEDGERVREALAASGAAGPKPLAEATTLIGVEGALTVALMERGFTVASRLPGDPEPSPEVARLIAQMDLQLELATDGRESITVLHAEVGPAVTTREMLDGSPVPPPTPGWSHGVDVTRSSLAVTREPGAPLYIRHVETLRDALGALGVRWEPQVEVVL